MNPVQYTLEEIEMAYDAGYKVGLAKGEALRAMVAEALHILRHCSDKQEKAEAILRKALEAKP